MRRLIRGALRALMVLALASPSAWLAAQSAYKYRDSNGQWVFTDQAPAAAERGDALRLGHENDALHVSVDRNEEAGSMQLVAVNDCLCVVTFEVLIQQSGIGAIAAGAGYRATLAPRTVKSWCKRTQATRKRHWDSSGGLRWDLPTPCTSRSALIACPLMWVRRM
jgi:hypothetical protein